MTIENLHDLCIKYPKSFVSKVQLNTDLLKWVNDNYCFSDRNHISLKEKIIGILHNKSVTCKFGNKLKFRSVHLGFRFCGTPTKCECHRQNKIEKSRENYTNSLNPTKIKKTLLEKYGVDHNWKISEVKDAKKANYQKKYGVDNPLKSNDIKEKIKITNLMKYGVVNPLKSKDIRKKIQDTNLKKYQRHNPSQNHLTDEVLSFTHNPDWLKYQHHEKKIPIYLIADSLGINASGLQHRFHGYGIEIRRYPQSQMENDIAEYILSLNKQIHIETNKRNIISPIELDIFIPEKQLAIEFCGLYWHSEKSGSKDPTYHLNKLKICNDKNIRLITIFSDEWETKQDIVKHRLKHILGFGERICSARETDIYPISSELYKSFVNQYHIQGSLSSKIKLGAFYGDQLVAAMGLGARRRNLGAKNTGPNDYEMLRFCSSSNVPGVGGKLFKYFVDNYSPHQIISYADRRWGEGEFYRHLGFEFVESTGPSYFYTNDYKKRHNRFAFRKDVIVRELKGDANKTEWENMQTLGYDRIWDCGTNKWIWNKIT